MKRSCLGVVIASLPGVLLACSADGGSGPAQSATGTLSPFGSAAAAGGSTGGMSTPVPTPVAPGAAMPTATGSTGMEGPGSAVLTPPVSAGSVSGDAGAAPAGAACSGVPIVPDATGLVALGSNSLGIHGSWFVYSDCKDLGGVNCASVTAPAVMGAFANVGGKMCTSGQTSMSPGAWGAGLGLELNDGPPQMPYDTVAMGVTGFCFTLSGPTIPSTSLRVAFPTQNHQDDPYFTAVTTPGQHSVTFAESAQGSWVTTKSDFEATRVTLLQFQIPSSATAPVPWDFCVEGLTALVQ